MPFDTDDTALAFREPMKIAQQILRWYSEGAELRDQRSHLIHYVCGSFFRWEESQVLSRWVPMDVVGMMDWLWKEVLPDSKYIHGRTDDGELIVKRVKPTRCLVRDVAEALRALTKRPDWTFPVWLGDPRERPKNFEWHIMFRGHVYDPTTDESHVRDRRWFDEETLAVPLNWAVECPTWMRCVEDWSGGEQAWKDLLQMWMGYSMMRNRRLSKWMLMYGVSRSGKGVIAQVMRRIVGEVRYKTATLLDLTGPHALEGLERAQVLEVSEMAELKGASKSTAGRVIKNIVGCDPVSVNPKGLKILRNIVVPAALTVQANTFPQVSDEGGALLNKVLILRFTRSFDGTHGRRDPDEQLAEKLMGEIVAIAAWAAKGARKLWEAGRKFPDTTGGVEALQEFRSRRNAYTHFLETYYEPELGRLMSAEVLWEDWCDFLEHRPVNERPTRNSLPKYLIEQTNWNLIRDQMPESRRAALRGLRRRAMPMWH